MFPYYRKNLINKSKKSESYSFRAENTVEIVDTNMIREFHELMNKRVTVNLVQWYLN